jgi:hypothetical protein
MPQNQALGYSNDHVRILIITLRKARITFEHSGHVVGNAEVIPESFRPWPRGSGTAFE